MYQLYQAQEQADLYDIENRPFSEAQRLRIEFLEDLEGGEPSLLDRIVSIFRPTTEEVMDREAAEADIAAAVGAEVRRVA